MIWDVSYSCRVYGSIGIFSQQKFITVEAETENSAREKAFNRLTELGYEIHHFISLRKFEVPKGTESR